LQFIRALYPIASFIAKKLSGKLPNMHSITADFSNFIKKIELLKEIITSIRSMKKYMDIPLGKKLASKIKTNDQLILDLIKENSLMA
jgi:valyl-tRNA synthetase